MLKLLECVTHLDWHLCACVKPAYYTHTCKHTGRTPKTLRDLTFDCVWCECLCMCNSRAHSRIPCIALDLRGVRKHTHTVDNSSSTMRIMFARRFFVSKSVRPFAERLSTCRYESGKLSAWRIMFPSLVGTIDGNWCTRSDLNTIGIVLTCKKQIDDRW